MPKYIERPIEYPACLISPEAKANFDEAYHNLQRAYEELKKAIEDMKIRRHYERL